MSLVSITEPLDVFPGGNLCEKNLPDLFYAGMLADILTDGLKINLTDGLYQGNPTSRERIEKLLQRLSEKYFLIATANATGDDARIEFSRFVDAGWELVAPAEMCISHHNSLREADCPYLFTLYGYPRKNHRVQDNSLPKLPRGLRQVTPEQLRLMNRYFQDIFWIKFDRKK